MATIDDIVQTALTVWRDHETPGVPATKAWEPPKADIRALFVTLAGILRDIINRGVEGDNVTVATWAELAAIPPTRPGQAGFATNDSGTHSQSGTGESNVPNQGAYSGTSGGLWKRVGDFVPLTTAKVTSLDALIAALTTPKLADIDTLIADLLDGAGVATIQGAEIDVTGSGMSMQDADGAEFLGWEGDDVRIGKIAVGDADGAYLRGYDADGITRFEIAPGSIIIDGEYYAAGGSSGPATLVGPIMGGLTHNSIRFMADVEGGVDTAKLEISTSPAFMKKKGVFFDTPARTAVSATGGEYYQTVNCDVSGLDPKTRYWARWWLNGQVVGDPMTFKTMPAPGTTGAVKIAWLS